MIRIDKLSKVFSTKKQTVIALNEISLNIPGNRFVLIKGHSGCGKSTLLFSMGGMLEPTSGTVNIYGKELYKILPNERAEFRAKQVGFVFQSYYLVPYLNVLENILFQKKIAKTSENIEKAKQLAEMFNLQERLLHQPTELSIGEKQRVALARALITKPKIILADEPTGNLDPDNANEVLNHLHQFKENGGTVVMVTHNNDADYLADIIYYMESGKIKRTESK